MKTNMMKIDESEPEKKYMLDTNVFNHFLDGKITLEQLSGHELFATHIQRDELEQTRSSERRSQLLSVFQSIEPKISSTATTVWGISKWGLAKYGDDDGVYEALLKRIRELDEKFSKNKKFPENQSKDALIAETAIREGLILVTNDRSLTIASKENGCQVEDLKN